MASSFIRILDFFEFIEAPLSCLGRGAFIKSGILTNIEHKFGVFFESRVGAGVDQNAARLYLARFFNSC